MAKKRSTFRKKSRSKKTKWSLVRIATYTGFTLFLAFFFTLLPGQNIYYRLVFDEVEAVDVPSVDIVPLPINTTGLYPEQLGATGIIIEDMDSAIRLFERNPDSRMAPASTTKMMTALVALDMFDLEDALSVKSIVSEGRLMGLQMGETISVENLLYGILIHSGNDAAQALADNAPGGYDAFIAAMNKKASELSLTNTYFVNPIGFDDDNHYSTPADLARLAKVVLANHTLKKIVGIPSITVSDTSYSLFHPLTNVNELVGTVPGVSGVKTGFTENAGESVITVAKRNGHQILIVILHSNDRFGETRELIDWAFTNHEWREIEIPT